MKRENTIRRVLEDLTRVVASLKTSKKSLKGLRDNSVREIVLFASSSGLPLSSQDLSTIYVRDACRIVKEAISKLENYVEELGRSSYTQALRVKNVIEKLRISEKIICKHKPGDLEDAVERINCAIKSLREIEKTIETYRLS